MPSRWVRGFSAVLASLLLCAASAAARAFLPPRGHVFAGLTGGTSIAPFEGMVGKHPPVFETFMTWNTSTTWLASPNSSFRARLALHISTATGYGRPGVITPEAIALGRSDRFLVALNRSLAHSRRIVYVRLMGEMDGFWNPYSAFGAGGASRGPQNSSRAFVQAWRRTVVILRGGPVKAIDRRLRGLGLPQLQVRVGRGRSRRHRSPRLPRPKLAFLWVPQDVGSPNIPSNQPADYWPGSAYVDWVGTDFYASSPNFGQLDRFYGQFAGKARAFVISEWALYGKDDPQFVKRLFAWVRSHRRVRMLNYYQGFSKASPPNLAHYPRSRAVLRRELRSRRFVAYPPEFKHRHRHRRHEHPPHPPHPGPPPGPPQICLGELHVCIPV